MANRIHSKGDYRHEEAAAGAAGIYPGMLVMINSSDAAVVHATEGGIAEKAIVMEDALQGKTVDDVCTSGAVIPYGLFPPGSEANVLLKSGEDVSIGEDLISAGDGTWKSADNVSSGVTIAQRLAKAMEALDLSDSGSANTLVRARMI
jgi:hypothetical protein